MKSYKLFKECVGGYNNIGATAVDFQNFKRDLKAYIQGVDAQMLIDKQFRKVEVCPAYFFEYDVDESDQLTRLFWADPICRKNFSFFGDVVSFDATYGTNRYNMVFVPFTGVDNHKKCITFAVGLLLKEDVSSYVWLLTCFRKAMVRPPTLFITDQDPSMRIAIERVFPECRHRYCMWHIMSKVTEKVGPILSHNDEFLSKLNAVVWTNYLEPEDFEVKWKALINEFSLENHKWFCDMFDLRKFWIPAYFRDLFMGGFLRTTSRSESENNFFSEFTNPHFSLVEFFMHFESAMDAQRHNNEKLNDGSESYIPVYKTPLSLERHAAQVYTLSIFYEVQAEICSACFGCRVLSVNEYDGNLDYVISDERNMVFKVSFIVGDIHGTCSCKYFERIGLVCRHMFVALKDMKLDRIPDHFVTTRWCKKGLNVPFCDIGDSVIEKIVGNQENEVNVNRLWADFYTCVALVEKDESRFQAFAKVIKEQKQLLSSEDINAVSATTRKQAVIESFYGCTAPAEVNVFPPKQAKNKGSGRRIKGPKELSIEDKNRPKRLCRSCNELCNHDSRNCPLKTQDWMKACTSYYCFCIFYGLV